MLKCTRIPTTAPVAGLAPTDYIPADGLESGTPDERGRSFYGDCLTSAPTEQISEIV